MASDSAGTLGTGIQWTIGQQEVTKVSTIRDARMFSSTGSIGMSQLIANKIGGVWNEGFYTNATLPEAGHRIGTAIAEVVRVYAQNGQALQQLGGLSAFCQSLVAIAVKNKASLFQFDISGVPEYATVQLPFVALGSG